jgi:flagellar M-ring protein FliF
VSLALALVALVIVFSLLRPALKAAMAPPLPAKGGQLDEVVADEALSGPGHLPKLEAPAVNNKLEAARQLARDNPAAVAGILRNWVNGEAT